MITTLIAGMRPARADAVLLSTLGLVPASMRAVWNENLLLGVRNEDGDIYRAIGVAKLDDFLGLITMLHTLGFSDRRLDSSEIRRGFHAVVSQLKRS